MIQENKDRLFHDKLCYSLLELDDVRFAGVISKLGNLVSSQFNSKIEPIETIEKRQKMYMQMALEIAMRKEFDSSLGEIEYISTKRKNVLMISIPVNDDLLLVSASPNTSTQKIVNYVSRIIS